MHSVGVGTLLGSDRDDTGGAGESLALTVDASGAWWWHLDWCDVGSVAGA